MLNSLFGDLRSPSRSASAARPDKSAPANDGGFAATTILESVATEVNAQGQMIDRHSRDLIVTGSPAQAIREHFAATRSDLDTASAMITLLDPVGVWASAVVKALSDAGGLPIERLHLRANGTLQTLATIERTTLVRRDQDTLRVVHADVRAPGSDNAEIPIALMERSQMTTVVIGPLQPPAIDALLVALNHAAMLPTWRCPNLLFMLPPNAVWIANKINAIAWPGRLNVRTVSETLTGASAVWNAMLRTWNLIRQQPGWEPATMPAPSSSDEAPVRVRDLGAFAPLSTEPSAEAAAAPGRVGRATFDPARARIALAGMLAVDGLLGCAVVEAETGQVLALEQRNEVELDMERLGAAAAPMLCALREAGAGMGLPEPLDEIISSAGERQQIVRTLTALPQLFVVALFDRRRTNVALARYQLMELEHGLAQGA